ncbi:MAG: hypothetical protein IIB69_10775 [Proteobacteria bacterium]|nr:hypothetical protein [Pseudomonadota bacterium]MCH8177241.1 hypothetical protein [Pseudomonadota bacterium]
MSTDEITAKVFKALAITGLVSMAIACGGGGSPTSESVVTRGVITSLGSIWVNGVEYETPDGGSYSNDDSTSTIASYEVGQVVSLRGTRHGGGVSGTATEVDYEAEIEGAADSTSTINGVTILITPTTNVTKATLDTSGDLIDGLRYEVSGFWLDNTTIEATFIKDDDDSGSGGDGIDEVKGFVEAPNLDPLALTVRGVTYTYSGTPAVSIGDLVEIHFDPSTNIASRVELEDDFFDNLGHGQEVELEGAVNMDPDNLAGCPTDADFLIDRTCIDWDSVDEWMDGLDGPIDMVSGLRVEAEGHFNAAGDLLIAEKIKGRGNRVRISAIAINVDTGAGSFDLFFGDIQVTTQSGVTRFDDGLTISTLPAAGLEVRGIRTGATSMLAIRIKADSVGLTDHELRAEVDLNGANSGANTITVMGISSVAGPNTELEDEDIVIAPGNGATTEAQIDSFLSMIDDDDIVNFSNGPRDVIDVRIDTTNGGNGSSGNPYAAKQIEIEREDD